MTDQKIPVVLDTDIGSDIDDTWALAMLLKCPQLDLKLVTSCTADTTYRAEICAKLLEVAGRTDVAVGVGIRESDERGAQDPYVDDYDLGKYPGAVHEDGVGAMIETIMGSPTPVTLIAIGPVPNVAAALAREPRIADNARFVGMHGSLRLGYGGAPKPQTEYNVSRDPVACQKTFAAPWEKIITPLDTCGLVRLTGDKYRAVAESKDPLTRAVIENYIHWCRHGAYATHEMGESSTLFDTVAVYLAYATDLCKIERLGVRVRDDGMTVEDPAADAMDVATEWNDLEAFEDLLVEIFTRR